MSIDVDCPGCHTNQGVGEELIGRYTLCQKCGCRFYVVVPPLGARKADEKSSLGRASADKHGTAAEKELTVSDLFWDSQKGEAVILKLLREQQRLITRLSVLQWVTALCAVLSTGLLALLIWRS